MHARSTARDRLKPIDRDFNSIYPRSNSFRMIDVVGFWAPCAILGEMLLLLTCPGDESSSHSPRAQAALLLLKVDPRKDTHWGGHVDSSLLWCSSTSMRHALFPGFVTMVIRPNPARIHPQSTDCLLLNS